MERPKLFLLHFAGGNCHSFRFMMSMLTEFEAIPLELPGRGRRIRENLLFDFDLAAKDIYNQIIGKAASLRFVIYGHSMGAYLALRVSNMLEKAGTFPACLIVSGNAGPGIKQEKKRYLMPQEDFIEELKTLGGISYELVENEEFFQFLEPILRADFQIAEKNEMVDEPAVNAPLYALMGSQEEEVEEISNWAKFTRSEFNYEILEGDHFFIHQHAGKIAAIIKSCYEKTKLVRHRFNSQ